MDNFGVTVPLMTGSPLSFFFDSPNKLLVVVAERHFAEANRKLLPKTALMTFGVTGSL
jgi:hypothetical protein